MLNIVDLFSGAGGLTEGFRIKDHFKFICHIEKDFDACSSLALRNIYYYLKEKGDLSLYFDYIQGKISKKNLYLNIPREIVSDILHKEITDETLPIIFSYIDKQLKNKQLDGIIGGPPCQAYSTIGRVGNKSKKATDKRIYLYRYYLDFLVKYKPKFFIFENVKGLLSFKDNNNELLFPQIINEFNEVGYEVTYHIVNASEYGVSQNRERLFIVGHRKDLMITNSFFDYLYSYREQALTLEELFNDLPQLYPGATSTSYSSDCLNKNIQLYYRDKNSILTQHTARPHKKNDLIIYKLVVNAKRQGKNLKYNELPEEVRTHSNLNSFLDRYKALDYHSVSHTVVSHIAKDGHYYIHPDIKQNRSITVREAARIQGFPDNFYFEHSRTSAFKQIGNAVPVILSKKLALSIIDFLNNKKI